MKRLYTIIMILAMLLTASGCGERQESIPSPGVSPAAVGSSEADPAADRINENMFAMTMENGRLYLLPFGGGEAVLLADKSTVCFNHRGSILYAAFDDGSVMKTDLSTGKSTQAVAAGAVGLSRIYCCDGGFVGISYSMTDSSVFIYREADGSLTRETRFGEFVTPYIAGDKLAYTRYENDQIYINVWDLDDMSLVWYAPAPENSSMYSFADELYLYDTGNDAVFRMNTDSCVLEPMAFPMAETDFTLSYIWDGRVLVEGNYSNDNYCYIVTDSGRQRVEGSQADYLMVTDTVGERVLLQSWEYYPSEKVEDSWYYTENYYVLDMAAGELTKVDAAGRYSPMFAAGDFPVMDSSTARKPVTAQIYSFFCERTGYGGAVPLCSTTHNAWLNIADGVADIALLAAPTKEEEDYLKERNVEVEMKLYGGDGLVFIGNRACGVENLTLDQARAIFRGEITNWAQLGGADHPIRVLYRDDQSGSQRLFEKLLWSGMEVPNLEALGFERLDEMSTIVSECLYDPYSIGYSIMTYLNDVYGKEDLLCFSLEGYEATPQNVREKLYPLSTRGYVVMRSDEPEDSPARRLFNWFGSPLCDRILTDCGVTPLHED